MIKKIFILFSKIFLSLFYDKKYFRGKYFENGALMGYRYAWKNFFPQKILGYNRNVPWPVSFRSEVSKWDNITFDIDDIQIFWHFGCYFQNFSGKIYIGKGTFIAPNVGIITANHNVNELGLHDEGKDVVIGERCWIGMNSVVLPGVTLGDQTVVGAGAVVTHSFPEGHCIIGGVPAKKIRDLGKVPITEEERNEK